MFRLSETRSEKQYRDNGFRFVGLQIDPKEVKPKEKEKEK